MALNSSTKGGILLCLPVPHMLGGQREERQLEAWWSGKGCWMQCSEEARTVWTRIGWRNRCSSFSVCYLYAILRNRVFPTMVGCLLYGSKFFHKHLCCCWGEGRRVWTQMGKRKWGGVVMVACYGGAAVLLIRYGEQEWVILAQHSSPVDAKWGRDDYDPFIADATTYSRWRQLKSCLNSITTLLLRPVENLDMTQLPSMRWFSKLLIVSNLGPRHTPRLLFHFNPRAPRTLMEWTIFPYVAILHHMNSYFN